MKRRNFIKHSGLTAAAVAMAPAINSFGRKTADGKIKMAIIGVGARGQNHLDLLLRRDDVELVAICEIEERALRISREMIQKSGKKMPQVFTGDVNAWKKMLELKGIDGVLWLLPGNGINP